MRLKHRIYRQLAQHQMQYQNQYSLKGTIPLKGIKGDRDIDGTPREYERSMLYIMLLYLSYGYDCLPLFALEDEKRECVYIYM